MSVTLVWPGGVAELEATEADLLAAVFAKAQQLARWEWMRFRDLNEGMHAETLGTLGVLGGAPLELDMLPAPDGRQYVPAPPAAPKPPPKRKPSVAEAQKAAFALKQAKKDLLCVFEVPDGMKIFISGQTGVHWPALEEAGITRVINCCDRIKCAFRSRLHTYYVAKDFFDTKGTALAPHLPPMLRVLDEARADRAHVLVHCMVGASRSTSTVLAWLMSRLNLSYDAAYAPVRSARAVAKPNAGFAEQLQSGAYLQHHRAAGASAQPSQGKDTSTARAAQKTKIGKASH
eukprot:TRINITY_DN21216_c0_g1_i1.p1 TRINITY_DN21216_c0_g1~~TRINITY_DN21216_c0_g1_i1.p1  ORF type:complete len:289 (+),score=77.23 TRINITY_DN21216_c0_g1_i1:71-937(+)